MEELPSPKDQVVGLRRGPTCDLGREGHHLVDVHHRGRPVIETTSPDTTVRVVGVRRLTPAESVRVTFGAYIPADGYTWVGFCVTDVFAGLQISASSGGPFQLVGTGLLDTLTRFRRPWICLTG